MKKCREIIGHFNQSNQMNEVLRAAQLSLARDKPPLQLIQDVVTRWWSTQTMLARLIKLKAPLRFALNGHRMEDLLHDSDWAAIEMVEEFLRPFAKIQKFLEGEKYVTVSFVPALVQNMRSAILNLQSTEYNVLADQMMDYFESRFGDGSEGSCFNTGIVRGEGRIRKGLRAGIYIAAACDPRTKALNCIPAADKRALFAELANQVAAVIAATQDVTEEETSQLNHLRPAVPSSQQSDDIFSDILEVNRLSTSVDADFEDAGNPLTPLEIANHEISQYRRLPVLPHTTAEPSNPLEWWKANGSQFPNLSQIAKKVLCVPATSASSERIFSASGSLLTKKRNKLSGETAAAMVFLHGSWQKLEDMEQRTRRSTTGRKRKL